MNIQQFTKWLRSEIKSFSDPDPAENQFYEAAQTIRQAGQIALSLGLPEVAELCSLRTTALSLPVAQKVLSECLQAIKQPSDTLTPPQAATILGVNPEKILTWIRSGELRAVNIVKKQGGRPKYRITKDEIKSFLNRRTVQTVPKNRRVYAPYRGKQYY
jgi:excisionase family DNA binding protein